MKSLIDFALNEEYERVKQLGDRLMKIESVIDWEAFRYIRSSVKFLEIYW
jgi:hypothetical protein